MPIKEKDRDVLFEITEHIGVIATTAAGWTKELNLVSWNGALAKYDIRDWSEDHEHMSHGITFNWDELVELRALLAEVEMKK